MQFELKHECAVRTNQRRGDDVDVLLQPQSVSFPLHGNLTMLRFFLFIKVHHALTLETQSMNVN